MRIPPPPPGFKLVNDRPDPTEILLREGFTFNNGYRTDADTAAIRAQGYTPAPNSAHNRGDGLDVDHPRLSRSQQKQRLEELFSDWPGARIIDEGHHRHMQLPGWGAAPGTPGTPNFGLPDLPAGYHLTQRGSLSGGNWTAAPPANVPRQPPAANAAPPSGLGVIGSQVARAEEMARQTTTDARAKFAPVRASSTEILFNDEMPEQPSRKLTPEQEAKLLLILRKKGGTAEEARSYVRGIFGTIGPDNFDQVVKWRDRPGGSVADHVVQRLPELPKMTDGATGAGARGFADPINLLDEMGAVADTFFPNENRVDIWDDTNRSTKDILYGNIDTNRAILEADARDHPVARLSGQLASGVILPAGRVKTPAQFAKVGAAYGGAAGFGAGEGNPLERLPSAAVGTIIGGAGGYGLGRGMEVGGRGVRRLFGGRGPNGEVAEQSVYESAPVVGDAIQSAGPPSASPGRVAPRGVDPWQPPEVRRMDARQASAEPPIPDPPPGFKLVDEPGLGGSRPMGAEPSAEEIAAAAARAQPGDFLPIPGNRIESAEEAAAIPSRVQSLDAPDPRAELAPRRIATGPDPQRQVPRVGPIDLTTRVRQLGGIRDEGGELRAMGIGNRPRGDLEFGSDVGLSRLVNNESGLSPDDITLKLWEEGYFPNHPERPGPDVLFDALERGARGQRIFHPKDWDEVARFEAAASERARIDAARQAGSPLAEDVGQPVGLDDIRQIDSDVPAYAYEDLPTLGGRAGNLDVSRLETRGDIRRALRQTEVRFGGFDAARRGRITHAETGRLAEELGMTPDDLLRRRKGQALNAEQALQARRILAQSADELVALAARVNGGGEEAAVTFQRALVRHAAIQEQVTGATAEAGRALSQFRVMARSRDSKVRVLQGVIASSGGRGRIEDVAEAIIELQRNPGALNSFAAKAVKPRFRDKAVELYVNALLSGPQTHAVNYVSNLLTQIGQIPENLVAAGIGGARRLGRAGVRKASGGRLMSDSRRDAMLFSEVGARALGMVSGTRRGLVNGWRAFKTETPTDMMSKVEQLQGGAISGVKGKIIRIPTRAMMGVDEVFKGMARQSAIDGLAVRQAYKEGLRGAAATARAAELAANPTDEMVAESFDFARYVTFQRPVGAVGQGIMRAKEEIPLLTLIAPFVRTPTNLLKYAVERSPMAPLLKQWRADIRAGGAKRDIAAARALFGSGLGASIAMWAGEGKITGGGPADANAKRLMMADGWQPYSVKIGDKWVSYQRLDPYATMLGLAADLATKTDKMTPAQQERGAAILVTSILQQLESKTWISGIVDLVKAIENPERSGQAWIDRTVGSIAVPTGFSQVARTIDPVQRDKMDVPGVPAWGDSTASRIMSRIPGLSDNLPAKVDVWGQPVTSEGGAGPDILSPLWVKKQKNDPVTREVLRLGARIGEIPRRLHGRRLSDAEFQEYRTRAGRYTYQDIAAAMADPEWRDLDDGDRLKLVDEIKSDARRSAREELGIATPPLPPGFSAAGRSPSTPAAPSAPRRVPPSAAPPPPAGFELIQ